MHVALLANLKKNAPTWEGMSPTLGRSGLGGRLPTSRGAGKRRSKVTFLEGNIELATVEK